MNLQNKVAVVTGASSGLGIEFADALACAGASVALLARRGDRLASAAEILRSTGSLPPHIVGLFSEPIGFQQTPSSRLPNLGQHSPSSRNV